MQSQESALIIAVSENVRQSLLVLLRSVLQIDTIHMVDDVISTLILEPEILPALVILDHNESDEVLQTTLCQLKARWPQARYLVIVDDEGDRLHAQDTGADVVLMTGVRAATILEAIEGLLSENHAGLQISRGKG
jgi:DNA-binding NarL/FixJ family response regulator